FVRDAGAGGGLALGGVICGVDGRDGAATVTLVVSTFELRKNGNLMLADPCLFPKRLSSGS
ncbi:MAG: hypothetical protein ABSG14_12045, partial [Verrucomicrobiia bacterium]